MGLTLEKKIQILAVDEVRPPIMDLMEVLEEKWR